MRTKKSQSLCKLKAVILVGGSGTRLQPLTFIVPKSLVPVLNRPVMEHMLAYLKQFGIEDIILTLSYLPDAIRDHFGDGRGFGIHLTYCVEKDPLGTAGAVKNAESYLDGPFIVLNGDIFTEMNLADMLSFHIKKKAKATISMTWMDDVSRYGVIEVDDDYRVLKFLEKPPEGVTSSHWINAGIYILEPEVLKYIPVNQHYMFERGLFPNLLVAGEPVFGYPYRGYWLDMGTLAQYFSLNMDFLFGKVTDPLINDHRRDNLHYGVNVSVDPSAKVTVPVIIDRNCLIGKNVRITGPATIGKSCIIQDGASLENAVLWDNISIGANSRLNNCIISSHTVIADNQEITNAVITPSQTVPLSLQR